MVWRGSRPIFWMITWKTPIIITILWEDLGCSYSTWSWSFPRFYCNHWVSTLYGGILPFFVWYSLSLYGGPQWELFYPLTSCRVIVECLFGQLKEGWNCIQDYFHYNKTVQNIRIQQFSENMLAFYIQHISFKTSVFQELSPNPQQGRTQPELLITLSGACTSGDPKAIWGSWHS